MQLIRMFCFIFLTIGAGVGKNSVFAQNVGLSPAELLNNYGERDNTNTDDMGMCIDSNPDLAVGGGTVLACWESMSSYWDHAILVSRSTDDGKTWDSPRVIPGASGGSCQMEYVVDQTWRCYWRTRDDSYWVSRSFDDGLTWGPAAVTPYLPERDLTVARGNSVTLRTTTSVELNSATGNYRLDTFVQRSKDGGNTWGPRIRAHSETRAPAQYSSSYYGEPAIVFIRGDRFALLVKNIFLGKDYAFDYPMPLGENLYYLETDDGGYTWNEPEPLELLKDNLSGLWKTPLVVSRGAVTLAFALGLWNEHPDWGHDLDILFRHKSANGPAAVADWTLFE